MGAFLPRLEICDEAAAVEDATRIEALLQPLVDFGYYGREGVKSR